METCAVLRYVVDNTYSNEVKSNMLTCKVARPVKTMTMDGVGKSHSELYGKAAS